MPYRQLRLIVLPLLLVLALPTTVAATDIERALCSVCAVREGETEMEKVRATTDYDGQSYYFCSESCLDIFVEDPVGYLPPVLPRPAPTFAVRDLDGRELAPVELPKGPMLVDFWATWCPPCLKDLPRLSELHQRYADAGFSVVSVSIDEGDEAAAAVARAVKKRKASHPIYLDSLTDPSWESFLVRVVPTQFLIDGDGSIVAQWSGVIDLKVVDAAVEKLVTGSE